MSFQFEPTPAVVDPLVQVARLPINSDGLKEIVRLGEAALALGGEEGRVGMGTPAVLNYGIRITRIAWLRPDKDNYWIYQELQKGMQDANGRFWNYDLWGFHDDLQYCLYDGAPDQKGHFSWHMDKGENSGRAPRKLSASLLLSDPADYDGGDFEYMDGTSQRLTVKDPGTMIVFPAFVQHRVTPVTRGVRRSLVAWAAGPRFR